MKVQKRTRFENSAAGFTLAELMVSMVIGTVIFAGLMNLYSTGASLAYDQGIKIATNLQVQAILQTIGSELRILGNGVPFDQANFQIGETTLFVGGTLATDMTVADPIQIADATASHITFRLNETGQVHLLTQDFDPSTNLEMFLTDVDGFDVSDPIYISSSVVSGDDGLYGVITAVDTASNSITIDGTSYTTGPAATFDTGSTVEEVPLVTFDSGSGGITRNSGFGNVILGEGSSMTLDYLDFNGTSITLPLTRTHLTDSLRSIKVTITMVSDKKLSSGQLYSATAEQIFGIRNLNYVF